MSSNVRPLVLAVCLIALPMRRAVAEERVDLTLGYYLEDNNRVEVWTPALLWETDVTPHTVMRLQGVYDVVSGASPTGAPPKRRTREVITQVPSTLGGSVVTGYQVVSGPTGTPSKVVPVYGTATTQQTTLVPYGRAYLPLHDFDDQRLGLNLEFEHHEGSWLYTGGVAYGDESDYKSLAGTLKVGREFNHKATLLSLGASLGHDWVQNDTTKLWEDKDIVEGLLSLTHAINTKTLLTISGTLGTASGYMNDQYKYASVDDTIIHEQRPDTRDRRIAYLMLNRAFDSLHGSVEASYRFYNDTYGIDAHTYGLTWFQHCGKHLIIAPSVRYYEQSAADFYAVQFTGKPDIFSSDYRLSKLSSLTAGMKFIVKFSDKFNFSVAYDRYSMWGRDGVTSGEAYPDANVVTVGCKLWY